MKVDTGVCVTLKPVVKSRFVLFVDNLKSQVSDEFKQAIANAADVCWFGLPVATNICWPVNVGFTKLLR